MSAENCKNVLIGSGEGGKYLAWHQAQSGEQTMVIERRWIGGSCPNVNCLPAKNEIRSANVADLARHGQNFGTVPGQVSVDREGVRRRKREMVEALVAIHGNKNNSTGICVRILQLFLLLLCFAFTFASVFAFGFAFAP